ncbi:hypothetical protein NDU88_009147 [Pleurodeles waltl]|uniref:Uncharacterized protein n=1 Tax=Pleurodeles waltl TaxID=8319 RepID=A0AAV7RWT9_PLEWA|nr:hypothetical protein NDU88_009147 [Pleurodeles waltl]
MHFWHRPLTSSLSFQCLERARQNLQGHRRPSRRSAAHHRPARQPWPTGPVVVHSSAVPRLLTQAMTRLPSATAGACLPGPYLPVPLV